MGGDFMGPIVLTLKQAERLEAAEKAEEQAPLLPCGCTLCTWRSEGKLDEYAAERLAEMKRIDPQAVEYAAQCVKKDEVQAESAKPGEATKFDGGKLRYDLIPPTPLALLAQVYTMGGKKYNDWNWAKGMAWSRMVRAGIGHFLKFAAGEDLDEVDKQFHLSSVAWCAFTLLQYRLSGLGTDDRRLDLAFPDVPVDTLENLAWLAGIDEKRKG